jgi:hypothetical protein
LELDGFGQIVIKGITPILDGYDDAASAARNDRDRSAAVAAKRKKEGVELLVLGVDGGDDIFFSLFGLSKVHDALLPVLVSGG